MMTAGHTDSNKVNEVIDEWVIAQQETWQLSDIVNYVTDCHLSFKKMHSKKKISELL